MQSLFLLGVPSCPEIRKNTSGNDKNKSSDKNREESSCKDKKKSSGKNKERSSDKIS